MSFDAVVSVMIKMQELREKENYKKEEMKTALRELMSVQKKIASIEQDLVKIKNDYLCLDDEVRPNMAVYLKSNPQMEGEEYLF